MSIFVTKEETSLTLTPKKIAPHLQVVGNLQLEVMTIAKLKEFLERHRQGPPIFLERHWLLPPETSTYILRDHNWGNRKMRDRKVMDYTDFMRSRNWSVNNMTVGFGANGRLLDGQQRCKACEAAGVPFPVGFCFGLPDDAFDTMDMGASRNHEDVCKSLGAKYPRETAVAIRWVEWIMTKNALTRKPAFSPQELPLLFERHRDVEHWISDARKIVANTGPWISAGVIAAFLHVFHAIDSKLAVRFAAAWQDGSFGEEFQGLRQAQQHLSFLRDKKNVKGGDAYQSARAGLLILAWNAARSHQRGGKRLNVTWGTEKFHVCPHIDGGVA